MKAVRRVARWAVIAAVVIAGVLITIWFVENKATFKIPLLIDGGNN
jgi:hypothetical protein